MVLVSYFSTYFCFVSRRPFIITYQSQYHCFFHHNVQTRCRPVHVSSISDVSYSWELLGKRGSCATPDFAE